jgi:hypothetical protein
LSEKDLFNDITGKTFKESTGIPANEHAKKKSKEKSVLAKKEKPEEIFYTIKNGKILQIKVRANGAYSSFVGKKSKLPKDTFDVNVKTWKTEGTWLSEEDYEEKVSAVQKRLAGLNK